MVRGIFHAFNSSGFDRLIGVRQPLNAFLIRFRDVRQPLRIAGLAGAIGSDLARVFAVFVQLDLIIPFEIGVTRKGSVGSAAIGRGSIGSHTS